MSQAYQSAFDSANPGIVVVMPAHNEAQVIGRVIAQIPRNVGGLPVTPVVVDDGSTDSTAEVARRYGATVFRHITNLGVGAATITGLKAAQLMGAQVIVTMDSDGQHDPAEITNLVRCLMDGQLDVVIGSRIMNPQGMPATRFFANLLLNAVTYFVYQKIVSDSQSGFKVFSREALDKLELQASGYEICSEIVGEIYRKDLCYKSVPIKAVYTSYSQAKGQPFLNGINLILGMLVRLMRRV